MAFKFYLNAQNGKNMWKLSSQTHMLPLWLLLLVHIRKGQDRHTAGSNENKQ